MQTVKGISFLGPSDEFVVSGSDDGHIYIWSKQDGKLQQWLKGDDSVVNCLEPHPHLPCTLATSGEALCLAMLSLSSLQVLLNAGNDLDTRHQNA